MVFQTTNQQPAPQKPPVSGDPLVQVPEPSDPLVEVLTSQVGVAIGGHHLKDAVVDGQQGHIEGASDVPVIQKDRRLREIYEEITSFNGQIHYQRAMFNSYNGILITSGKHTKNYGKSPSSIGFMNCKWPFSIVMLNYQRAHEKSRKTNLTITIFMISKSVPKYSPNMKFLNENIYYIYISFT